MGSPVDPWFIEVRDYKAFPGTTRLDLAPLTVVFGPNGSGKSALVRLPLLVSAALRPNADAEPGLPLKVRDLHYADSFSGLLHGQVPGAEGLGVRVGVGTAELSASLHIREGSPHHLPSSWIQSWSLRSGGEPLELVWNRKAKVYERPGGDSPGRLTFRGLVPSWDTPPVPVLPQLPSMLVEHLGPARKLGDTRFVATEPWPVWDVGFNGADTGKVLASLMAFGREDIVQAIKHKAIELLGVVLRVVEIRQGSAVGYTVEAQRRNRSTWLPLRELGTGLAHLLPVLVQQVAAALAHPEDSPPDLLVVEEPEAHLHPRVHLELADLLLVTARGGRTRVLVETHSETLILRLQRRVAEDPHLAARIALVWVDDEGADTRLSPLRIGPDGDIPGWPEGWFDAALQESRAIRGARLGLKA